MQPLVARRRRLLRRAPPAAAHVANRKPTLFVDLLLNDKNHASAKAPKTAIFIFPKVAFLNSGSWFSFFQSVVSEYTPFLDFQESGSPQGRTDFDTSPLSSHVPLTGHR